MQAEKKESFTDKRSGNERRCWHCQHEFPYVDSHGFLVTKDRRKNSGRRTNDSEHTTTS